MKIVGLTGSIGMGKSTIAKMFEGEGVPVFDADAEVHRLQAPGGRALPAIEAEFPGVTGPAGLDRAALGQAVFGDPQALKRLERIMHPMVREGQAAFLRRHRQRRAPLVILDIPLLFEGGGARGVDAVITVSAPFHVQRARVLARPGMTKEKFAHIRGLQVPDAEKRRMSDFVVHTGLGKRHSLVMVRRLAACLSAHSVRYCRQCVRSSSTPKRRASIPNRAIGYAKSARSN